MPRANVDVASALDELLDHVHAAPDPPPPVAERVGLVLLDTLGAICGGLELWENASLAAAAPVAGEATIVGRAARSTVEWAILVHGAAGTATELDEGHAAARGHPGVHVIPLALALGEQLGVCGRMFVRTVALGYEVAARVGAATTLRVGVHPHGTWGALGAATAAALLLGHDRAVLGEAVRVASGLTLAASWGAAYQGASVRNAFAGAAGQLGLTAARLAAAGFTGEPDAPAAVFGRITGERFDPARLMAGLGEHWEIERGYFKLHACCRYNHAALDALLALREREPFEAADVERVEVSTYAAAAALRGAAPPTPLAARFSVPFAVATALVSGETWPAAFGPAALADAAIRRLAARVSVQADPALTALGPERRGARVTVELRDGRRLTHAVAGSRGDPDQPIPPTELRAKFRRLARQRLGPASVAEIERLVDRLTMLAGIGELTAYLGGR